MHDHYNVLFLWHRKFGKVIMAEAILNFTGKPRFYRLQRGESSIGCSQA